MAILTMNGQNKPPKTLSDTLCLFLRSKWNLFQVTSQAHLYIGGYKNNFWKFPESISLKCFQNQFFYMKENLIDNLLIWNASPLSQRLWRTPLRCNSIKWQKWPIWRYKEMLSSKQLKTTVLEFTIFKIDWNQGLWKLKKK